MRRKKFKGENNFLKDAISHNTFILYERSTSSKIGYLRFFFEIYDSQSFKPTGEHLEKYVKPSDQNICFSSIFDVSKWLAKEYSKTLWNVNSGTYMPIQVWKLGVLAFANKSIIQKQNLARAMTFSILNIFPNCLNNKYIDNNPNVKSRVKSMFF